MSDEDEKELEEIREAFGCIKIEHPDWTADFILNAAIEATGRDVGMSSIDYCSLCEELYNTEYGDEYIDPNGDMSDLIVDCRTTEAVLLTLANQHYCSFQCLMDAVYAAEDAKVTR